MDALVNLIRPDSTTSAGPETMLHVVVDYDALLRGHTVTGEGCEIPGIGSIPVTLARQMAEDSILKVLLTKGVDVAAVAHGGYTIPRTCARRSTSGIRNASCPGATAAGTSRLITATPSTAPGLPNSRISPGSARGTTT